MRTRHQRGRRRRRRRSGRQKRRSGPLGPRRWAGSVAAGQDRRGRVHQHPGRLDGGREDRSADGRCRWGRPVRGPEPDRTRFGHSGPGGDGEGRRRGHGRTSPIRSVEFSSRWRHLAGCPAPGWSDRTNAAAVERCLDSSIVPTRHGLGRSFRRHQIGHATSEDLRVLGCLLSCLNRGREIGGRQAGPNHRSESVSGYLTMCIGSHEPRPPFREPTGHARAHDSHIGPRCPLDRPLARPPPDRPPRGFGGTSGFRVPRTFGSMDT